MFELAFRLYMSYAMHCTANRAIRDTLRRFLVKISGNMMYLIKISNHLIKISIFLLYLSLEILCLARVFTNCWRPQFARWDPVFNLTLQSLNNLTTVAFEHFTNVAVSLILAPWLRAIILVPWFRAPTITFSPYIFRQFTYTTVSGTRHSLFLY